MCEEEAPAALYSDGEIVWVKLGSSWWPGETKDLGSLPPDVANFKKPPLAVVKFFDEDLYEYVRSWSNIYPYNCEKKNEFIRKGLAAYRAKAPHMEKFPKDVSTAEVKIDGNPNILSDPEFMPKKKFNLNDLFQNQSPKMKKLKDKNRIKSTTYSKDTAHITHRRFLGTDSLNDYRAYICIQYPAKDRTSGDPEDDEVIKINTEPEQEYKCYTCTFTTKRLEVMIMHRKSHIQGVYLSTPPRKYKSPLVKRRKKDRPKGEGPTEKKKKIQIPEKSEEISVALSLPKEVKPKESKELTSELLAEWDDEEDEGEANHDINVQPEVTERSSSCKAAVIDDESLGVSSLQLDRTGIIDTINSKKGQKIEKLCEEHSTVDVRLGKNHAEIDDEKELDPGASEIIEEKQKKRSKEIVATEETFTKCPEVDTVSQAEIVVKTHERETRSNSRWDSRILEKGGSKGSRKIKAKESESFIKELESSTKKDLHKETSHLKNNRVRHSKGREMKESSNYDKNESMIPEEKSKKLKSTTYVEEDANMSTVHSKNQLICDKKCADRKETNSTGRETSRRESDTSDEKDAKSSGNDVKSFLENNSETPEKIESEGNDRASRSSYKRESKSTGEKSIATVSKTLWNKNENSGKKEIRISSKESKSFRSRNSTSLGEKEARSREVDLKSHWKRKTSEKGSKINERGESHMNLKASDFNQKALCGNDSDNKDSRCSERELKTSSRRDSRSSETCYKSHSKMDSAEPGGAEVKDLKTFETQETKSPESNIDKDIKSCFDFDEEEEEPLINAAPAGRKIPRVIPERKSVNMEAMDDIPEDSQSLDKDTEKRENFADDNLENTFKELMEITKVPNLPDIQNTLKCEQNFHAIKTIKFPDKTLAEASPPKDEVATKLTNPKKRFVKSFEDFEMMQSNIKRKEKEIELNEKFEQNVDRVKNVLDESLKKTVDSVVDNPQKQNSPEELYLGKNTSKAQIDIQGFSETEISDHKEPPAQLIEEPIRQLVTQDIQRPSNCIKKQVGEKSVIAEIEQEFAEMQSSEEEKQEMIRKTVPSEMQPEGSNNVNDEIKLSKIGMEKCLTAKSKAKLITPFKIQKGEKKQHGTLSTPISMRDVITNMTQEAEAQPELETKVHFANLKSKIMSKIIEESKLSNASKNKIMSLMESDDSEKDSGIEHQNELEVKQTMKDTSCHTPRTKILHSYMEDQNKSQTGDAVLKHSSTPSIEGKLSLPEETIQTKKTRWSMRGSHPKKDRIKGASILPEKSHTLLPREVPPFFPGESLIHLPEEPPIPKESAVALPDEPPKPIMEDVSQRILLDEIPLPEEIAVENIPLPPEPPSSELIPLDNKPSPSAEEIGNLEQPPLSTTEQVSHVRLVEPNRTEKVKEMVSQDTTKPLTLNLDNDSSESIFNPQSFLSSSIEFSPIETASAYLPDNAICLSQKKSKKRKHSSADFGIDWTTSDDADSKIAGPHSFIDDVIKWQTIKADSSANTSKEGSISSRTDKLSTKPNSSINDDFNTSNFKEAMVKRLTDSENDGTSWSTSDPQLCEKEKVDGNIAGKKAEDSHSQVQNFWDTSEQLATRLHSLTSDELSCSTTQETAAEQTVIWNNEQQSPTNQVKETPESKNDVNEQLLQETVTDNEQEMTREELVEVKESVIEEGIVGEETGKIAVEEAANVVVEQNLMFGRNAFGDGKTTATEILGSKILKKDSEAINEDISDIVIIKEKDVKAQEKSKEKVTIDVEVSAASLDRRDEEKHVSIVDSQHVQIVMEELNDVNNVETIPKKQDLQLKVTREIDGRSSTMEKSNVEIPVLEETVVKEMETELLIEETTKDHTKELAMEETLYSEKEKEMFQELAQASPKKPTSINQKSLDSRRNEKNFPEGCSNEIEIHYAREFDNGIKLSIQSNLSNISGQQEISATALANFAEMKTNVANTVSNISTEIPVSESKEVTANQPNVRKSSDSSFVEPLISKSNEGGDIGLEKIYPVPEMVHVEGNLTVVSEKDLADGQVEITPDQVISTKKPAMLSNFSMDFSDSTNDSCTANELNDFDSKGTEFTSNAMTKEIKQKCTQRGNTYGRLELLDILEGNSDNEKKENPKATVINDMCDFEDHIPSQIVCATMLTGDMLKDDAPKTSISVTTHKLLERLSETKNKTMSKVDSKTKSIPSLNKAKNISKVKPISPSKSASLPEPVVKTAAKSTSKDLDDIEDVKAFVIHKDLKKLQVEEPEIKPISEKPAARTPSKRSISAKSTKAKVAGKAKILQQTIITPAGEIIQPNVTLQHSSMTQQKAAPTILVTHPKQPPQPIITTKAQTVVQPVEKTATTSVTQPDDNVFDINSMPIVLSDELLTPESIEKMSIMIGTEPTSISKTVLQEKIMISTTSSSRPIVRKIIGKMATSTTPSIISQLPSTTAVKTSVKPRILSGSPLKVLKQVAPPMANLQKSAKYIIVPQSVTVPPAGKYLSKKPPVKRTTSATITSTVSSESIGNKIMIVTNQQGQQQRLLLTPAQQKLLGCQISGTKLTKSIVKGNFLQKGVPAATEAVAPSNTGIMKNHPPTVAAQKIPIETKATSNVTTITQNLGTTTQAKSKGVAKRVHQIDQKSHSTISQPQKTILIKTPQGQTVRNIQGTDEELEKQVAEQLEAIRASSGKFGAQQQLVKTPEVKHLHKPNRRLNTRKSDSKTKALVSQLNRPDSGTVSPPVLPLVNREVSHATMSETKDVKTQPSRPLNQLVIQDAMGNQTTITEGQILALPSETVDGQPQSYMLVTLDESGNLTPLNNEALMSLDPNIGLGGDLSNMVLQIDQGGMQPRSVLEQKLPLTQQAVVKSHLSERPIHVMPEPPPNLEPVPIPESAPETEIVESVVEQKAIISEPTVDTIATTSAAEPSNQQLIVTGDPIATQKFLESLSEGTTDLTDILANADNNSILIQADGQQILINTNTENQMLFCVGDSTEGEGNPIFATHPAKNQDILAAALADTDVFQAEHQMQGSITPQLSPNNAIYPTNVGNVLETSLTLSSPIMTPLEVPSTNNKKIPDDATDILTQVPKNVDLPITITDPNISQTVANQQVVSLIANELEANLELGLPTSEPSIATVSREINSPSYSYSLPTLEDSVDISTQKAFDSSMPLLNEDVDESSETRKDKEDDAKVDDKSEVNANDTDFMSSKKQEDSMNSDGSFLEEESRFTLGGEMCSSLSEPPPEMFDIPEVNSKRIKKTISSINNSPKDGDLMDMSHADSSNDDSCEIPLQPTIVAKSKELKSHFGPLKRMSEERDGGTGKRSKYD